jgi:4-amino-4-deoxy-L-arabinose transferase-like glycosyltransferase
MARTFAIESSSLAWRPPAWALPLVLLLALTLTFPRGYAGGGGDDWYYLEAARCAARHGICLPETHWAARFPLVLPMGASFALFGESGWTAGLVPLLYTIAALLLFTANVERRFGAPAATVAGAALALTPLFPLNALQPLVDQPEFAWTMAALLAIQAALERSDWRWAAAGGAMLAVAVMTRMSSLALLPVLGLGWLMLAPHQRRLALPFALAGTAVLGLEALAYAAVAGDPLFSWKLALHHGRIPSAELPSWVDTSRSPILNLDFIRNWRRAMGIHVHWTVDPLLNLLADTLCGLTLCGALALAIARFGAWRRDPWLPGIAAAALLHFVLLTYVLAVDPKPRMFLFEFAAAAATLGVLGVCAWRDGGRLIVAALFALLAGRALLVSYDRPDLASARETAAAWIAAAPPGSLATDEWTRRTFALVPGAATLPLSQAAPGRARLTLGKEPCEGGQVVRQAAFERREVAPIAWLRERNLLIGPQVPVRLCLVRP